MAGAEPVKAMAAAMDTAGSEQQQEKSSCLSMSTNASGNSVQGRCVSLK